MRMRQDSHVPLEEEPDLVVVQAPDGTKALSMYPDDDEIVVSGPISQ